MHNAFNPGEIRTISGPGWGHEDLLETMNRRQLEAFCTGHGLMGAAQAVFREDQPDLEEFQYLRPPAVIMRDVIRRHSLKGNEPLPEKRDPAAPAAVKTDYSKWSFPNLRKECGERGLPLDRTTKKLALIALLEAHDAGQAPQQPEPDFVWPKRS